MSKKLILFLLGIIFFPYGLSYAQVTFNEIAWKGMTTGSTHEWLELFNMGAGSEDISDWTIKDGIDQLNIIIPSGTTIPAGGLYVIKRTTSTVTPFNLSVAFNGGLLDSGEKLILANAGGTEMQMIDFSLGWPDAAMTSENTMQWNSSSWVTATPTPGATNETTTPPPPASDSSTSSSSSSSSGGGGSSSGSSSSATETKTKVTEEPKIKTKITAKTLVFTKIPVEFKAKATGYSNESLSFGRYFWNFGDGDSKEERVNNTEKLTHTYFYPGDYVVTLEYYVNYYGNIPDASDKITIKVVPVDILISGVGDEKDFFVELTNNTNYDADISKWILAGNKQSFVFPKNTILGSKKKIIFSSKITNFSIEDKNSLKLLGPQGELVFDYPLTLARTVLAKTTTSPNPLLVKERAQGEVNSDVALTSITSAPESLSASVMQSDIVKNDSGNIYTMIISFISFVFIGASAGAVYFLRQKKTISKTGDDFEILDG